MLKSSYKASAKQRGKGACKLPTSRFRVKIRNISGDEIVKDFPAPKQYPFP